MIKPDREMTTLYAAIDKTRIQTMPQELFRGRIVVIQTAESAKKAVDYLEKSSILGIDTETRPSFMKGINYKVSLLQISTHDVCFLFRLNFMGMPDCLIDLLSRKDQIKVGISLRDDFHALHERGDYTDGKYIDLQKYVKQFGITDQSLQKLYANVFRKKISKNQRLTNWEAKVLTPAQQRYAATDAWACIKIYEQLEKLRMSGNYRLISPINMTVLMEKTMEEFLRNQKKGQNATV